MAGDDDLRRRVTVHAADAEGMTLPVRLGGVLAMNMIGHLAPERRRQLWADLRSRLAPSAPLLVTLQPPAEPVTVPDTVFTSVPVGRHVYRGSGGARPAGPDSVVWTVRYEVLDENGTRHREIVVSEPALLAELTATGYTATAGDMGVVVAIPSSARRAGQL